MIDRGLSAMLLVAGLLVVGPVMGLELGWRTWLAPGSDEPVLRVASFNAAGNVLPGRIRSLPLEWETDVLAIQECGATLHDALQTTVGWHVDLRPGLCLVSRYPILTVEQMDREDFQAAQGSGLVATYTIDLGRDTIRVTNLHLETPRAGLERLREGDFAGGVPELLGRQTLREIEHRHARRWTDQYPSPHLVMGDFNAPVESRIYRDSWHGWTNAFGAVGWGFGATRMNGWIRARIDHVLADRGWRVRRAWVGPDVGSDHRPMIAEVTLRGTD
jgi:endonuclease/exonuclease/phosphatase (EEP) superfamily protein YafD